MTRVTGSTKQAVASLTLVLMIGLLGLMACGWAEEAKPGSDLVSQCAADLASRLEMAAEDIQLTDAYATTWHDTSLGLPEPGLMYAQVMTPGWQLLFEAKGLLHLYTTSDRNFKYGGPVPLWGASLLYLKPIADEPNFNGELWQSSLMGSNHIKIADGVSDFWPQSKGLVVFKRRMSRSTHELYWLNADGRQEPEPRLLGSAMDYGDAAICAEGEHWAAITKPSLGSGWQVEYGTLAGSEARVLPLPEGAQGWLSRVAWADEKIVVLVQKADGKLLLEADPFCSEPKWEPAGNYLYPSLKWDESMLLNKSFSLVIGQAPISQQGPLSGLFEVPTTVVTTPVAPGVEIGEMHFSGGCTVIARIPRLRIAGYELIGANEADHTRFAFIWGKLGTRQAAYTVDYKTGQVIQSFVGDRDGQENPKLFESPCLVDPLPLIVTVEPVEEAD